MKRIKIHGVGINMVILSIDASTKSSGWAIYKDKKLIDYGCITCGSTDLFKRIHKMVDEIESLIEKYNVTLIGLEEVRPETGSGNVATHKALMFLQGALAMMAHDKFKKIEILYLYPSEWRKACNIQTGRGIIRDEVKKKDILFVKETFGLDVNDDIADAIGIGYAIVHPEPKEELFCWED